MIALPSTRQIQFLIALQHNGSFHKAATACGVTQSTISAAIQEMETILGGPVIDRANRKKLIFTTLGQQMLQFGQSTIHSLTEMAQRAKQSDKPLSNPLRLGLIPTIAPYLLPQILRKLQKAFPHLTLHIHEMQSQTLVDKIEKGEIDFGIMAFPYNTKSLQQLPLMHEKFVCAVPDTMFPERQKLSQKDIESQKLLLLADGHCLRDHALEACRMKDTSENQDVSATSLATLIQLVAQGYGMTLLPEMVAKHEHLPKHLKILPLVPAPTREIGVVWRKNAVLQQDIVTLSVAIYRLMHGKAIQDDSFNITL